MTCHNNTRNGFQCLQISSLHSVSEEGSMVPPLPLGMSLFRCKMIGMLVHLIPPPILPAQPPRHEDAEDCAHGNGAKQDAVTRDEARGIIIAIYKSGNGTAEVTEADMHGNADATFHRAADVVAVPGHTLGHVGVDAGSDEKGADIFDRVVLRCHEHDVTDDALGGRCEN